MFSIFRDKSNMPEAAQALKGRDTPIATASTHFVLGTPIKPPFPAEMETIVLGLGCFWGAERAFWTLDGVYTTAVGYGAGHTPNPTYEEVCSGATAHNEVVLVVYDPAKITYEEILRAFWESHNPTQGMRQGNDMGTQYRSGIYTSDASQQAGAVVSRERFQAALTAAGEGEITTEIQPAGPFYYAEEYHQQYLAKNPNGYCGLGGTGVSCPVSLITTQ